MEGRLPERGQRLVLGAKFMGFFFSIHEALDGRKCLRRLEDIDFPCDKSSNPDKKERISVEHFSNTRAFSKENERRERNRDYGQKG